MITKTLMIVVVVVEKDKKMMKELKLFKFLVNIVIENYQEHVLLVQEVNLYL